MALDQNLLTEFVKQFNQLVKGVPNILKNESLAILFSLMTIDIAFLYIMLLIKEDAHYKHLLRKIPTYSAFVFLILTYSSIVTNIASSFAMAGIKASNNNTSINELTNPSKIANKGIEMTVPVINNYISSNIGSILLDAAIANMPIVAAGLDITGVKKASSNTLFILLAMLIASLIIIICFFILAMQLFVYQIEFAIVAAIGIILIPFGVFKHTEFIFEKAKNGIINFGIKYMFLATLAGACIKFANTLTIPDNPTWQQLFYVVLAAWCIAYLAINIPKEVDRAFA